VVGGRGREGEGGRGGGEEGAGRVEGARNERREKDMEGEGG